MDGESSILNLRYCICRFFALFFFNRQGGREVLAVLYYYFPLGWECVLIFVIRCCGCGAIRLFLEGGGTGGLKCVVCRNVEFAVQVVGGGGWD